MRLDQAPPCISACKHITYIYMHIKDHVVHVRVGGYCQNQNNLACTKSARIFRVLKLDTIWKEKKRSVEQTGVLIVGDLALAV